MLPPLDALDQLVRHIGSHCASGQQVLRAIDFGRFRQDGAAAVGNQHVDCYAEGRIGADAAVAVRATALQADRDVRRVAGLAPALIGQRQQFPDQRHALFNRLACSATVLDIEHLEAVAFLQAAACQPGVDLVGLASQSYHQHRREVGVRRIARQRALQDPQAQALAIHAATAAVGQRDDAVDMGEVRQRLWMVLAREPVGDGACGGGRAVHR